MIVHILIFVGVLLLMVWIFWLAGKKELTPNHAMLIQVFNRYLGKAAGKESS